MTARPADFTRLAPKVEAIVAMLDRGLCDRRFTSSAISIVEQVWSRSVDPDAAVEALEYVQMYLGRLDGPELGMSREQLALIGQFAESQGRPERFSEFLENLLPSDDEDAA
jgi:hypothetical protein